MNKVFFFIIVGAITMIEISCINKQNIVAKHIITEAVSLPRGRGGHAAGILNERVFVVGGTDWSSDHTTKSWLSDSAILIDNFWQAGPGLPHPVAYSMFASDKTGIYLAGGSDGTNKLNSVYHLANLDGRWNTMTPLPMGLSSGSGTLLSGKLYIACGWTDQGITNQMWSLDITDSQAKWTTCRSLPGPKRAFPALIACGKFMYMFGGMSPDSNSNSLGVLQDAYQYNPDKNSWLRIKDLPWPGYAWSGSSIDENHVILAGKADGKVHKDIYLIDVRNMTVQKIGETIIQATTAPLIKVRPDEFWLIAGEPDSNKNRTNRITAIRFLVK